MNMKSRLAACIALVLSASAACAKPLYSFDTTPSNLPKSVLPRRYAIALAPDLQALTTLGQKTVDIEVREPVARIVLNAVDIAIDEAGIDDNAQRAEISFDSRAETATLAFANAILPGAHRLHLGFTSKINASAAGCSMSIIRPRPASSG